MNMNLSNAFGFLVFGSALFFAPGTAFASSDLSANHRLWLQVMGLINAGIGATWIGHQFVVTPMRPVFAMAWSRVAETGGLQRTGGNASARGGLSTIA